MKSRLFRSESDRMLGGVCGGLGQYFNVDPVLVRLLFVLGIMAGISILIYPVLWAVIPTESKVGSATNQAIEDGTAEMAEAARPLAKVFGHDNRTVVNSLIGAFLVFLGITFLVDSLNIYWLRWLSLDILWPVVLIVIGLVLVQRRTTTA